MAKFSEMQGGGYQPDPRIPRFFKSKMVMFGIPQDITREQLLEAFAEYGANDETMRYEDQESTGHEKGGRAFFNVGSDE